MQAPSHDHFVRRLESFTDIVIGFSLAEVGISLVIPAHPMDIFVHPTSIAALFLTFGVLFRIWWSLTAVFARYFVPNKLMIGLNCAAVGLTIFQVFSLQMWLKFNASTVDDLTAGKIYFATAASTLAMVAALHASGVITCWRRLTDEVRAFGVRNAFDAGITSAGIPAGFFITVGSTATGYLSFGNAVAALPLNIVIGAGVGAILARPIASLAARLIVRPRPETSDDAAPETAPLRVAT